VTGAAVESLGETSVLEFLRSSLDSPPAEERRENKHPRRAPLGSLLDWSALHFLKRRK
jgi:hypothetical protein